jgi:hypothetical protein
MMLCCRLPGPAACLYVSRHAAMLRVACLLLQLLDRDLEEAEEQHQAALRSHLMVLDSLLDLQVRGALSHWQPTCSCMFVVHCGAAVNPAVGPVASVPAGEARCGVRTADDRCALRGSCRASSY